MSPYLFFWQTSQEVEEQNHSHTNNELVWEKVVQEKEIRNVRSDVWSGMFFSNLVMFFIITACAGALFANGITDIKTVEEAALALRPFAGSYTYILLLLG